MQTSHGSITADCRHTCAGMLHFCIVCVLHELAVCAILCTLSCALRPYKFTCSDGQMPEGIGANCEHSAASQCELCESVLQGAKEMGEMELLLVSSEDMTCKAAGRTRSIYPSSYNLSISVYICPNSHRGVRITKISTDQCRAMHACCLYMLLGHPPLWDSCWCFLLISILPLCK